MMHWRSFALLSAAIASWAAACGGKAADVTTIEPASDASTEPDSAADGGLAPGCPASPPNTGDPCAPKGVVCAYASDMKACGTFSCSDQGTWEGGGFGGAGCPLPPGLSCPAPPDPELTGTSTPVDRMCNGDADCVSVVFQTDCCGNSLAFGVNASSTTTATAAAMTCSRSFPGCGCPARPTVPETLPDDGGAGTSGIEAYCASGTCKTRYR